MSLDNYNAKCAKEYIDKLVNEIEELKQINEGLTAGKIMPVKPYTFGRVMCNVYSYDTPYNARYQVEKLYQENLQIHKENEKAYENNRKVYTAVVKLLQSIGLKTMYYVDSGRGRSKTRVPVISPWVTDIKSQIQYEDPFETSVEKVYKEKMRAIEEWERKETQKKREEEREREKKQKEVEKQKVLAVLTVKYGLDIMADAESILQAILKRNKYLHLAHYLEMNRNDWSEGCENATLGLMQFTVDSPLDKEIYDNISQYIENWGNSPDGRNFRDCKFNYNVLFNMVKEQDAELYSDYRRVMEYMDDN